MLTRFGARLLFACATTAATAQPALAQQTLNLTLGAFAVRGEDRRVDRDIVTENRDTFAFEIEDFDSGAVGVEWLVPLGRYLEAGAGVSVARRTVPSVYRDFVDNDGSEIEQDFSLRQIPVTLTVRVLPMGQSTAIQPYIGGGLGLIGWRYSETGDFIDFSGATNAVFDGSFVASGSASGPVALGGVRFAGRRFSVGGEIRYQSAVADLEDDFTAVSRDGEPFKLDLGGWTYQATFGYRFGG